MTCEIPRLSTPPSSLWVTDRTSCRSHKTRTSTTPPLTGPVQSDSVPITYNRSLQSNRLKEGKLTIHDFYKKKTPVSTLLPIIPTKNDPGCHASVLTSLVYPLTDSTNTTLLGPWIFGLGKTTKGPRGEKNCTKVCQIDQPESVL